MTHKKLKIYISKPIEHIDLHYIGIDYRFDWVEDRYTRTILKYFKWSCFCLLIISFVKQCWGLRNFEVDNRSCYTWLSERSKLYSVIIVALFNAKAT